MFLPLSFALLVLPSQMRSLQRMAWHGMVQCEKFTTNHLWKSLLCILTVLCSKPKELCAQVARTNDSILACMSNSVASKRGIISLHSILVRWNLESCVQFWATQFRKDIPVSREGQ